MPTAASLKPITNRSTERGGKFTLPEDGFVMLVPRGEAPNVMDDGSEKGKRIIQVVDDVALEAIMSKLLNRGGEMLMDNDHHSHEQDKVTDANGWQPLEKESLQNRADGLWGDPRWSTVGLGKVEGGVQRYISPEFSPASLQHLGGNRYRVTELTGLALTNRPGFRRLQKPLTNRDADGGIEDKANTNTMLKALLADHLGITETAVDGLDETTLKNRLQVIKTDAAKAGALKTELDSLNNREVDAFIKQHDAVIPKSEAVRTIVRTTFLANRATAEEMVAGYSEAGGEKLTEEQKTRAATKPLFNRDKATPPVGEAAEIKRNEERAAKISSRAKELCNREKGLSWSSAWSRAESEVPAA